MSSSPAPVLPQRPRQGSTSRRAASQADSESERAPDIRGPDPSTQRVAAPKPRSKSRRRNRGRNRSKQKYYDTDGEDEEYEDPEAVRRRRGGGLGLPGIDEMDEVVAARGGQSEGGDDTLKLRLDLNLDVAVELRAKVHGDLTLSLLN